MNRCTEAIVDIHGVKWYYPEICVDGGVFRAKNTYTNLTFPSGSFKHSIGAPAEIYLTTEDNLSITNEDGTYIISEQTSSNVTYDPMPYSGHFYGIRKYTGLAPNLPYIVNITGKSGSSAAIKIPTEIIEVEYNKNPDDKISSDHSGFRIADNNLQGGEFGKSIASKEDLLAIGCPKIPVTSGGVIFHDAGKVFLYRRNPRPQTFDWPLENYKSPWVLEKELTLPSGLFSDYGVEQKIEINGLPREFEGVQTSWYVGQDGRQFGHSVDVSVNEKIKSIGENKQEIVVVGGVGARWTRTFQEDEPQPVSVGIMLFLDEFEHVIPVITKSGIVYLTFYNVLEHLYYKDLVFKYFAVPRVKFDLKIIIYVTTGDSDKEDPKFPDIPSFITLKRIGKNKGYPLSQETILNTFSGIKSGFLETFPYSNAINSGLPPLLGICYDGSNGAGGKAVLQPAIDQFIDFYKTYTFSSGVKDFSGVPASGYVAEFETDGDVNWIQMSQEIIDEVLDTGKLVQRNQVKLFAQTVGEFNKYDKNFNIPPDSGGKVYIFEKESGAWNLIQEIRSPNISREYYDRFGHAVSISDNGEVIAIGSPYITQAVKIYERDYEARKKLFDYDLVPWVESRRASKYEAQIKKYYSNPAPGIKDKHELYLSLDQEDKFFVRLDNNIEEYKNVHNFTYTDIKALGSWTFITDTYAPTARLGYSVDVNEDGSVVVAGAPTDSLNFYNDADVYYSLGGPYGDQNYSAIYFDPDPSGNLSGKITSSWSSSLYSGSAHIFESRKYYPHSTAIEYGAFGNLHENISNNTADSGCFGYLSGIFIDKNFTKTPFQENLNIPREAGLVFIITPAEDRLSDTIFDSIESWLALGDRHLVLVGNDPRWEASGIYAKSNDIINKLLARLKSNMRIVPARNQHESLPDGYTTFNNIVPSFIPRGSTQTYVKRSPVRGSGVADIKITFDYNEEMPCEELPTCDPASEDTVQIQTKCQMPLRNYGDLRAEWNMLCCKQTAKGPVPVIYQKNWPLIFGSYIPDCGGDPPESPTKNQEPIPILVAAEKIDQEIIYPAVPAISGTRIKYETVNVGSLLYYELGSPISNQTNFSYSLDSKEGIDYNFVEYNVTGRTDPNLFYKPSDELGGILQAKATPKVEIIPYIQKEELSDKIYLALEYPYKDNKSSKIVIIPNVKIEAELLEGYNDDNILFYQNLVSSSISRFGESNIAQLNWNGRKSFSDGYQGSLLQQALVVWNNVDLDVSILYNRYNVAWLPNINGEISEANLNNLARWLSLGNKKLVITTEDTIEGINHANNLCALLGIQIELIQKYDFSYHKHPFGYLWVNPDNQVGGKSFINVSKSKAVDYFFTITRGIGMYALKKNDDAIPLLYHNRPLYDDVPKEYNYNSWDMNPGLVQINFPVIPGSGYRLFVSTDSQSPSESQDLWVDIEGASVITDSPYPTMGSIAIQELNGDRQLDTSKVISSTVPTVKCGSSSCFVDFQVENTDNISVYVSCARPRLTSERQPKSVRLIGISGTLIPLYQKAVPQNTLVPVGITNYIIEEAKPEYKETIKVIRTISTDNTKYCTKSCRFLGNQLIEDGPVVVAQQMETFSPFDAGYARSRITVITDSSILQGRYVLDKDGILPPDTYNFLRSLYPETEFKSLQYGRHFDVYNKVISPQRGSPVKYHLNSPELGLNKNFGNSPNTSVYPINPNESKYLFDSVKRPELPWKDISDPKIRALLKNIFISGFLVSQTNYAATSRISGVIDGKTYYDASIGGELPLILHEKGYDYLDFDKFPSGYPGDLFGYSVCVRGEKVLIGSPFSAFEENSLSPWYSGISLSLGNDGGAGAVYVFDKSINNEWSATSKLKPPSLKGQLSGVNTYSDQFGHSIDMQYDTIIVGAPNHSYNTFYENIYSQGEFARKNFNPQFDIPKRNIYDLGYSGIRDSLSISDAYQKNMGAIYLYENKISDWENKKQSWQLVEKVVSLHSQPSGERFGRTVYLTRPNKPYRSDADYCIFAGCNLASGTVTNVGVTYAKDIMLKEQKPSLPSTGAWISAKVFGYRDANGGPTVPLQFFNVGNNAKYYVSGLVVTTSKGEIFIEVSGQDPSPKGFISHRPYIESVYGYYQYGKLIDDSLALRVDCGHIPPSAQLPLIIDVENSAYVYNTLGLYGNVKSGDISASPSGLNLFAECASGSSLEYLSLYSSGIGSLNDVLNLSVRGK